MAHPNNRSVYIFTTATFLMIPQRNTWWPRRDAWNRLSGKRAGHKTGHGICCLCFHKNETHTNIRIFLVEFPLYRHPIPRPMPTHRTTPNSPVTSPYWVPGCPPTRQSSPHLSMVGWAPLHHPTRPHFKTAWLWAHFLIMATQSQMNFLKHFHYKLMSPPETERHSHYQSLRDVGQVG